MSIRLQLLPKPVAAMLSSPNFGKRRRHLSEIDDQKQLRKFAENLTRELQNSKPVAGARILRLQWLHDVLSLALTENNQAVRLIPEVDFPLSKRDQAWISEYFDTTTAVLEVCTSLRASMSNVEQGQLHIKYAICLLEKPGKSLDAANLTGAHNSLQEWIEVVQYAKESTPLSWAKPKDRYARLQGMLNDLMLSLERAPAKRKGFLEVLSRAKTIAILACTALTIGLSGKSDFSFAEVSLSRSEWGSAVIDLFQRYSSEAQARENIARGLSGSVEEMKAVNGAVQKLVGILGSKRTFPILKEEKEEISVSTEGLKNSSGILEKELEKLGEKIDEFVKSIIKSRSALLAHLQASVASAYF